MTELDRVVAETLTRIADDDVHVERLLAGARATGVRYRRRRRLTIVTGAVLSTVAVGAGIALTAALLPTRAAGPPVQPGQLPSTSVSAPAPVGPSTPARLATLPATDAPSPLHDPAQVGRPWLVHIGLDAIPFRGDTVQYVTSSDGERVDMQGRTLGILTVRLARTTTDLEPLDGEKAAVTVNGRPGTFAYDSRQRSGVLRWRPADGLWLQVSGSLDRTAALQVATAVRLDRAYRCVAPFRMRSVPAGASVETCTVTFSGRSADRAGMTVAIGDSYVTVTAEPGAGPDPALATEMADGRMALVQEHSGDGGQQIMEVSFAVGDGHVVSLTAEGRYDRAVVMALAGTLQWIGGDDPAAWPTDAISR